MTDGKRMFIQVPWSFEEHPKTEELSDAAVGRLVKAWLYCASNETDGALTATQARKLFTPKILAELLGRYVYEDGDGYVMHEWAEHQMTAATRSDLREKRAAAGAAGGKAKAARRQTTQQSPSKPVASATANGQQILPELDVELELEPEEATTTPLPPAPRGAAARPARTRIPPDFRYDAAMIAWARERCPQITPEQLELFHRRFVDHWENAPAKTGTKTNWLRTWQNWIETDYARLPAARSSGAAAGAARPNRATERLQDSLATIARLEQREQDAAAPTTYDPALEAFAPRQIGSAR